MSADRVAAAPPPRHVYRVAEITRKIKAALEGEFGMVWIEGEVSNFRAPGSGHFYFTLKDEAAQIRAVLFRQRQAGMKVAIQDGLKLLVYGQITVYEKGGDYQILVHRAEAAGRGDLQAAFEALKRKLAAEGLFDPARKRPLPALPQHIGIVTSPTGAALRDILNILDRRFPNLHIVIAPARVQGAGAAEEIAAAIDALNARGGLDVMIVGRGGGSLEDLWCFNEEIGARAIARSAVPVISAVGHEIDFTISDFAADLRAPTPSAAAELVVRPKAELARLVDQWSGRLARALRQRALELRNRFTRAAGSYVFREPANLVRRYAQQLAGLRLRLAHAATGAIQRRWQALDAGSLRVRHAARNGTRRGRQRLETLAVRLKHALAARRDGARAQVQRLAAQLRALGPQAVLERGYSITRGADGRPLRDAAETVAGSELVTQLARGKLRSTITEVFKGESHGGKSG